MSFQQLIRPYLKTLLITLFGYGVIILGIVVLWLRMEQEVEDFTQQTNQLFQHPFQVNAAARIARLAVSNSQNELLNAAIDNKTIHYDTFVAEIYYHQEKLTQSLGIIQSNFLGDMDKVLEARTLANMLQQRREKVVELLVEGKTEQARYMINAVAEPLYHRLLNQMDYIVEFSSGKAIDIVIKAKERGDQSRNQLRLMLFLFALFTLVSGAVTAIIIVRSLQNRDSALRKVHDNLRIAATAFEAQEGMIVTDAEQSILRVNTAFTRITGYSAEDVLGRSPQVLFSGQHHHDYYREIWDSVLDIGYWDGEVWNRRKDGERYPLALTITAVKNDCNIITNYVGTLTDITEKKQAEKKIKDLAYYDPLTHLPNRRLMVDRLHHAVAVNERTGHLGALLFLDIDHFKTLNDTLGHDMGDKLLIQAAQRLKETIRGSDTVSRFGGDEFVILIEELDREPLQAAKQVEDIANKILTAINRTFQLASHSYNTSTSIGITLFYGNNEQADELLKQADIALYQAKNDGRNVLRFFDPQMQAKIFERAQLEEELYLAIKEQQFQLFYQMQVDAEGQPTGAEALIRWHHPLRGLVSPLEFIPLAEQNGSIIAIGDWVLNSACAQLQAWQSNPLTESLTLSVNVSVKQFHQADFIDSIRQALAQHEINPSQLKLELTESLLLDNVEETIEKMQTLARLGVQFALDDFGTGYSSLQYLKQLPLYQLKIDKSFVDELVASHSDQAIVRTIIAMAHSLGLNVIAEGVETSEQRQSLYRQGCRHYQGFLLGRPVSIEQFEASLKS